MTLTVTDIPERILARLDLNGPSPPDPWRPVEGGCWLWRGGTFPADYGSISLDNESKLVHRLVYEAAVGPIPEGYEIDHVGRIRACTRPEHLEAVTPAENVRRTQRPHCRKGHPFTVANTGPVKGKPRQRVCRECARQKARRYRLRGRAQ
jgi:HNH endonuclease